MFSSKSVCSTVLLVLLVSVGFAALEPEDHPLFSDDAVHEIHLNFSQGNWWSQLSSNFQQNDIPYLAATFTWNDIELDSIGVRFKGNSSYNYPGDKKSFKLDLDEFISGQELDGLDKLNLNNSFLDPSLVREKCAYELCTAMGLPESRTNYAALYINEEYWGLYLLVEQYDQEFIESRYGASEEGNLWKCEPNGTFEYNGSNESSYHNDYELKTNEELNDWSDLVDLVTVLNNTDLAELPDSLHGRLDVNSTMAMLAIDNFLVNLDSYVGRCANFYMYHRDRDSRFVFNKWDQNEAWGVFNQWNLSLNQMKQLDPHWVNTSFNEDRPLAERLWEVEEYDEVYIGHMKRLMAGAADPVVLLPRMEELREMIRPYVITDPNFMFSTSQFDNALDSDTYASGGPPPGRLVPGLRGFIEDRHSWLEGEIGTWTAIDDLVLNEVMSSNSMTIADEYGDYEDWIEIVNIGDSPRNLSGLGLTDHLEGVPEFVFPDTTLAAGAYLIVWADEEPEQGAMHAPFKLSSSGEGLFLTDGAIIIDQVTLPELGSNVPWGRFEDGNGSWQMLSQATPGAENQNSTNPEEVLLYINEFLASNESGASDETGAFADWVEIYNPGPDDVEMAGLFLSDDLEESTKWSFPDTLLTAGSFLVVWCDNDEVDGPLHSSFKLSAGGEDIAIFGRLEAGNPMIDGYTFGEQSTDISEGRFPDGVDNWFQFEDPSPGDANNSPTDIDEVDPQSLMDFALHSNYPNPFNPATTIHFTLNRDNHVRVVVFNSLGERVAELLDQRMQSGSHQLSFDGSELPSGVYYCNLTVASSHEVQKMMILK